MHHLDGSVSLLVNSNNHLLNRDLLQEGSITITLADHITTLVLVQTNVVIRENLVVPTSRDTDMNVLEETRGTIEEIANTTTAVLQEVVRKENTCLVAMIGMMAVAGKVRPKS